MQSETDARKERLSPIFVLYGTGNWYKYDSLSNGNGNSSVMLNVYGNNFSTGRLGYCIYFFSILSFRTLMNVDVDVMVGMLVASKRGELDRDVYNEKKTVVY